MDAYRGITEYTELGSIGIARGVVARMPNRRGVLLRVQYGTVWITQHGSSDDVCLKAGESFRIDRDGLTLVSACGPTSFALVALEPPPRDMRSLAERTATRFWNCWTRLYRAASRPSTGWT